MRPTFDSSGTAQQQRWAKEAIIACAYPFDSLDVDVEVQWIDPLPVSSDIGHGHSYMVTSGPAGGPYMISIATWADDPTASENAGLPDPALDIYEFYRQSFVHELMHVVHFTRITTDEGRTQAARCFWHPSTTDGALRRRGALSDWSASAWAENIMEAIAESLKCATYRGRLIYANRTDWNIDERDWEPLMALLYPFGTVLYENHFETPSEDWNLAQPGTFSISDGKLRQHFDGFVLPAQVHSRPPAGDMLVTVKIESDIGAQTPMFAVGLSERWVV